MRTWIIDIIKMIILLIKGAKLMSFKEISLDGFITEIKNASSGSLTRKFCFVIGAGASVTSGIKSGKELVDIWDVEIAERNARSYLNWKTRLKINQKNKYGFYSHYYDERFDLPRDGYNYLVKMMSDAKPSSGYIMLAHLLTTNHNIAITTNFDHLIEDSVKFYLKKIPLVIGHESLAHYITKKNACPTIVKIHRDLLFEPANRVEQVEKLHDNWKKALDFVFAEYNPIFIGYAGNDNSLMNYLLENSNKFANGEFSRPYWMLYKNDTLSERVYAFINRSSGYYIKHSGFDEVLCLIGKAFEYKTPSKEDLFSDAEKRYQVISETNAVFSKPKKKKSRGMELNQYASIDLAKYNSENDEEGLMEQLKAVTLEPDNSKYHHSLGVTLHKMKNYESAIIAKQEAVKLEPENARYHHSLGITFHDMKMWDEAVMAIQKAIELDDSASYHYSIASTLYEMKRDDVALIEKHIAIELAELEKMRYQEQV